MAEEQDDTEQQQCFIRDFPEIEYYNFKLNGSLQNSLSLIISNFFIIISDKVKYYIFI